MGCYRGSNTVNRNTEKLKANENVRGIRPAKLKIKTRFVLTKVQSDTTEEEIELELLDWFGDFEEVYVRKNPLKKHNEYATFIVIVTSEKKLNIKMIENFEWPGEVRCFFAPNNERNRS